MVGTTDDVIAELSELKATYAVQSDKFIKTISDLNDVLNERVKELWEQCKKFDEITEDH